MSIHEDIATDCADFTSDEVQRYYRENFEYKTDFDDYLGFGMCVDADLSLVEYRTFFAAFSYEEARNYLPYYRLGISYEDARFNYPESFI